VTAAQERRLILAALDYATQDRAYRNARRIHLDAVARRAEDARECEKVRSLCAKARRLAKLRLLRAAGLYRSQTLLPLEKMRDRAKAEEGEAAHE